MALMGGARPGDELAQRLIGKPVGEPGLQNAFAARRLPASCSRSRQIRRALAGDHENASGAARMGLHDEAPQGRFRCALRVAVKVEDRIDGQAAAAGKLVEARVARRKRMLRSGGKGLGMAQRGRSSRLASYVARL